MIREETPLLIRKITQDGIVGPDNQYHMLTDHSELLSLVTDIVGCIWDGDFTMELLPIHHLAYREKNTNGDECHGLDDDIRAQEREPIQARWDSPR